MEVINGKIVDKNYIKKAKMYHSPLQMKNLSISYKQSLNSPLNKYKNLREMKKAINKKNRRIQDEYIEALRELIKESNLPPAEISELKGNLRKLKRLGNKRFNDLIRSDSSETLSFSTIFTIGSDDYIDDETESVDEVFRRLNYYARYWFQR